MTHPVTAQLALETALRDKCSQIAALLGTPLSEDRSRDIHAVWQEIARSFGPYQTGHARIHPTKVDPNAPRETPAQIAARLDLMQNGAHRASLWPQVAALLARQTHAVQVPLQDTHHIPNVTRHDDLLSYLTSAMHHLANPIANDRAHARENHHLDIGLSGGHFINLMQATYRILMAQRKSRPFKFLDVGCGGGTKVIMASHFFEQSYGLEYNRDFLAHAQQTLTVAQVQGCEVFEADALTYSDYGAYDVVYFYRPISNLTMLTEMETQIIDQVSPGTILLAPMEYSLTKQNADRVTAVAGGVYLAHTSKEDATQLRARAEMIGPDWQLQDDAADRALGFWQPIIAASRSNGFCLTR